MSVCRNRLGKATLRPRWSEVAFFRRMEVVRADHRGDLDFKKIQTDMEMHRAK